MYATKTTFHRLSSVALLTLVTLSGCSLFNKPDRSRIVRDSGPSDGGLDAIEDMGPDAIEDIGPDGFLDAGPDGGDAGPDAGPPENCAVDGDEDQNGLADCADFACAGADRCCDAGSRRPLRLDALADPLLWRLSEGFPAPSENVRFGVGPHIAVRRDVCDPIAQGIDYHVSFSIDPAVTEPEYAALTLSSVNVAIPGRLTEFAARVTIVGGNAVVTFSRGGEDLRSVDSTIPMNRIVEMQVQLRPSTDDEGHARLSIQVLINSERIDLGPVLYVEHLLPHCRGGGAGDGTPGLYFGLEGHGDNIEVVTAGANAYSVTQACSNPTVFERDRSIGVVSAQGDADSLPLDWNVAWSGGGIRSPSLSHDGSRWHIYGEASHEHPELVAMRGEDFPWVIGHSGSRDSTPHWEPWFSVEGDDPAVGSAGEIASAPAYHHHETEEIIYMYESGGALRGAVGGNAVQDWVNPGGECQSVHQPEIGRIGTELLILYLCETPAGTAIRFQMRSSSGGTVRSEGEVAPAGFFGEAAAHGLQDLTFLVDAVNEPANTDFVLRLWAIALGRREATVVLGTAGIKLVMGTTPSITNITLTPYPANPVATANSLFPRDTQVLLQGITVARVPGAVNQLRFLVGRRVEFSEGGRRWDFAPVGQLWRAP